MVLFFLGGSVLRLLFRILDVESASWHMLLLFASTICYLLFVFFIVVIAGDAISLFVPLNMNVVFGIAVAAACLFPISGVMKRNEKPVLPIHALLLELCDIISGPVYIDADSAAFVRARMSSPRGGATTEYFFTYRYNGRQYMGIMPYSLLSDVRAMQRDDRVRLAVYPNTGIAIDIISVERDNGFCMLYDDTTGMYTVTVTPQALNKTYDRAVIPAVTVSGYNRELCRGVDVSQTYSPEFGPTAAGYLGAPYRIECPGADEVRLTFTYDEAYLSDKMTDGFKPAIYCLDEKDDYYPVSGQVWEGNQVTATITCPGANDLYMLIDENAFHQWQEEYEEYWRQYQEEHPEEWERMKEWEENRELQNGS